MEGRAQAVDDPNLHARFYDYVLNRQTNTLAGGSAGQTSYLAADLAYAPDGAGPIFGSDVGDGRALNANFFPFGDTFTGGVSVALGNIGVDEEREAVLGMETGGSEIRVFPEDGPTTGNIPITNFLAYENTFTGGVRITVANVDPANAGDEIIVAPGPGRAPTVKVFAASGQLLSSHDVYDPTFTGGVFVAAANFDDDPAAEIVVGPGAGGGPHVRIFSSLWTEAAGFFAFAPGSTNGVRVAAGVVAGESAIVATTRLDAGGVVRVFNANGTQASGQTLVTASDGDLAPAVGGGHVRLTDAAPRFIGASTASLRRHTRNVVTLKGAGLSHTFNDIFVGTEENAAVVYSVEPKGNDLEVAFGLPASTPAGPLRITLSVTTPGGTHAHNLVFDGMSVAQTQDLRGYVTTGVGSGGGPHVRTYNDDGALFPGFMAGDGSETSGVRIARADFDGEGTDEYVVAYGPGQFPEVYIVNNAQQPIAGFDAYEEEFVGGVFVAAGDVDGDGLPEIVTAADAGGGPHVKIFSAEGDELGGFMAYGANFHGGVRLAIADVDADGIGEIVTAPGPGGGPHVRVFTAAGEEVGGFMAYGPEFTGGVYVAGADVDGDGFDEVVTGPGRGGGPHVRVFTETGEELDGFMAYAPEFTGGVTVAGIGDDIVGPNLIAVGAGAGGGPHVKLFDVVEGVEVDGFMAYDPKFTGGVFVAGGIAY